MAEETQNPQNQTLPAQQTHANILNKTLAELLQTNPAAQNMVMSAMQISPQQFQQLVTMSQNNQLMNQPISELFKNGTMQQAAGQVIPLNGTQINPQQMQQLLGALNNQQGVPVQAVTGQPVTSGDTVPYTLPAAPAKPSLLQKLKSFFG